MRHVLMGEILLFLPMVEMNPSVKSHALPLLYFPST